MISLVEAFPPKQKPPAQPGNSAPAIDVASDAVLPRNHRGPFFPRYSSPVHFLFHADFEQSLHFCIRWIRSAEDRLPGTIRLRLQYPPALQGPLPVRSSLLDDKSNGSAVLPS